MASGKKRSRGDTPRGLFLGSDGALSTMVAGQHQESGAWFPRMVINAAIEAIQLPPDPEAPADNFLAIVSDGMRALTTEQMSEGGLRRRSRERPVSVVQKSIRAGLQWRSGGSRAGDLAPGSRPPATRRP